MPRIAYGDPAREWLHPENFGNEPIYCEAHCDPDDIIYHGSDDEAYDSPSERRARYEMHARRFLQGQPIVILSASLRGPFDKESGWVNPWIRPKSTSRSEPSRKRRRLDSGGEAERLESSQPVQVGSEDGAVLPDDHVSRYLDPQTFHRISTWRDQVVAESSQPAYCAPDAQEKLNPISLDSGHATQHAVGVRIPSTASSLSQISRRGRSRASTSSSVAGDAAGVHAASLSPCAVRASKKKLASPAVKTSSTAVDTMPVTSTSISETLKAPGSAETPSGDAQAPVLSAKTSSESVVQPAQVPRPPTTDNHGSEPAPVSKVLPKPVACDAAEHNQETVEPLTQPNAILPGGNDDEQAKEEEAQGDAGSLSQIDGPTLVTSRSASISAEFPSFGHFSFENQSQEIPSEVETSPRKLLWPKSQKLRTKAESQSASFGLESSCAPNSQQPRHGASVTSLDQAAPSAPSADHMSQHNEEAKVAPEPEIPTDKLLKLEKTTDPKAVVAEVSQCMAESEPASAAENEENESQTNELANPDSEEVSAPVINHEPPATAPEAQSPWAADDIVEAAANSVPLPLSQPCPSEMKLGPPAVQSPWARGDSQIRAPEVRLFNPLSSPANSHVLSVADLNARSPVPHRLEDMCNVPRQPPRPSTPDKKHSGLPSPDFTLSVKSFKEFMTPSPQPAKRRRVSGFADPLPSTQLLQEAATSNPWAAPSTNQAKRQKKTQHHPFKPKAAKRVSWAPLPGEEGYEDKDDLSPVDSQPEMASLPRPRATSPPPSILSTSELPAANQKFGKHFAAVTSRRIGTTPLRVITNASSSTTTTRPPTKRLLPSESRQVCPSPGVGEMAEAFLRADAAAAEAAAAIAGDERKDEENQPRSSHEESAVAACKGGNEEQEGQVNIVDSQWTEGVDENNIEEVEEEMVVDDVSAVMGNLDEFLGPTWDLDAELDRQTRENGVRATATATAAGGGMGMSSFSGLSQSGLSLGFVDSGVWD
ncbi:hypothetical protein VTJ04DRAFT_8513 [Mycothermus thermophilus]|uniref:uncharacterized protein n=1 Tax=Humicola insolens TaxID=85995 RepID=UPI0037425D1F